MLHNPSNTIPGILPPAASPVRLRTPRVTVAASSSPTQFMTRYALYFAPAADSLWWQAGCRWLGRDPSSGQEVEQVQIADIAPRVLHTLTADARRYGFHATLKAPFRLADGCDADQLDAALKDFCRRQQVIEIPAPRVEWLGSFLALRPGGDSSAIDRLAMQCVSEFDHLRAPLRPEELARRQQQQLSARQLRLLQHWGYPYTAEEFRFHMTLTDGLHNSDSAAAIAAAAQAYFAIDAPLLIQDLALFVETTPGAPFELIRRYPFLPD
ncbi:DUF1045 domain-containing protein [Undibacterium griseum]|uniref:DUF1045 domain-containing protein n=1 Tax=Undibacterium griseum TaxID=2762295 RepID=A0ABR6YP94_9BURK|nr:DUF1045 domain-containing protein [Undibacterium griseum]MBC3885712.1 DUF1045 domain-containing protein [Undibacterium griseum]